MNKKQKYSSHGEARTLNLEITIIVKVSRASQLCHAGWNHAHPVLCTLMYQVVKEHLEVGAPSSDMGTIAATTRPLIRNLTVQITSQTSYYRRNRDLVQSTRVTSRIRKLAMRSYTVSKPSVHKRNNKRNGHVQSLAALRSKPYGTASDPHRIVNPPSGKTGTSSKPPSNEKEDRPI